MESVIHPSNPMGQLFYLFKIADRDGTATKMNKPLAIHFSNDSGKGFPGDADLLGGQLYRPQIDAVT